jgi:1-acyl-sn-glycerol-3-phosphate acyltransferase
MDRKKYTSAFRLLNYMLLPPGVILDAFLSLLKFLGLFESFRTCFHHVVKRINRLLYTILYDLQVDGLEHIPAKGGAIIASNHSSWLDPPIIWTIAPRQVHFMAKIEEFSMPILKSILEITGSFPVDREHHEDKAIEISAEIVRKGELFVIFPEGTIPGEENYSREDILPETGLLRGHTGAVRIALATGVPIIPVGVSGANKILPPEVFPRLEKFPALKRGRIRVKIGTPISTGDFTVDNDHSEYDMLRRCTDEMMARISRLVSEAKGSDSRTS